MKEISVGNQEFPCANTERQNDRSHPESPDLPKFMEPEQKIPGMNHASRKILEIETFHNKNELGCRHQLLFC